LASKSPRAGNKKEKINLKNYREPGQTGDHHKKQRGERRDRVGGMVSSGGLSKIVGGTGGSSRTNAKRPRF